MDIVKTKVNRKTKFKIWFSREFSSKRVKGYLILFLAAFICVVSYDYFISATTKYGFFQSGLGALARMIAIYSAPADTNISTQNTLYFIYFFIFNLPLLVFSIIKLSWRFSIKTLIFIFSQIIFNFIISHIPYINPSDFHILINYHDFIYSNSTDPAPLSITYQIWLFIFAIIGSLSYGYACSLAYYVNASTGGTDFASMYISVKHNKSIGNINLYINFAILIIIMLMSTFNLQMKDFTEHLYPWTSKSGSTMTIQQYRLMYFFGPTLFASLLFILLQSFVINHSYPKYQYRTLFIITKKSDDIIKSMRDSAVVLNDISVWDVINSRLDTKEQSKGYKIVMSTITLLEYRNVKYAINRCDKDARIFLQKVDRIAGTFRIRNDLKN